ncbi:MAG: PAS domain S-box protein [Bacteroidota bacterium]|jgi:PAS domain S-box-containing protein
MAWRKFTKSIAFKIWLPFATSILFLIAGVFWYYPQKQKQLFLESTNAKLRGMANTVALGVELSLAYENFEGLERTINLARELPDFEFVAILQQGENKQKEIFTKNPVNYSDELILQKDESKYYYQEYPLDKSIFNGSVLIATSKKRVDQSLYELNTPVHVFLISLMVISMLIFYMFAIKISKPIRAVTDLAIELEKGNYNINITPISNKDEIGDLNNAFYKLKRSLKEAKQKNDEFNKELEIEINKRTRDLSEAQTKLLQAQDVARLGNFELDLETDNLEMSKGLKTLLALSDQDSQSLNQILIYLNPDDRVLLEKELMASKLAQRYQFKLDLRIIGKRTVKWIYLQAELHIDPLTRVRKIRGIIQDISTRKTYEEELDRLSLVAKKTSNCVVITDLDRRIVWVNDSLIRLSGYSREEIIGNTPRMFQFEKTNIDTVARIRELLSKDKEVSAEILNRGKHGNEYWLQLDIVPLLDKESNKIGYMAVETDITERKNKETEISELLDLTQNQNSRLRNYAHIVSHNLRSHSSNFYMLIELLKSQHPHLTEDKVFSLLNQASNNLEETISHLKEVVLMNDKAGESMVKIELKKAVEKACIDVVALASEQQVKIINEVNDQCYVIGIPAYIDSIILNFLTNGIKYKSPDRESYVKIRTEKHEDKMVMLFEDNGLGIDLNKHGHKLFGMYKKFHSHKDSRGVGLFISKNQIEAMGGSVSVQSEPNVGTTFKIEFKNE